MFYKTFCLVLAISCLLTGRADSEVTAASESGFQVRIVTSLDSSPSAAYNALTQSIGQWWLADHTYTGESSNLSMDLKQGCLLENLPADGFVRHLEIVYHQPGRTLRLTGGLGPLQAMGVHGAMTFTFRPQAEGTELEFTYNVSGYSPQGFSKLAPVVNHVLEQQLTSLKRFCDSPR